MIMNKKTHVNSTCSLSWVIVVFLSLQKLPDVVVCDVHIHLHSIHSFSVCFLTWSQYEMFAPQQFGFREKYSTELAALNLVDYLTYKMDAGKIPANICIDVSKAFDTLSHSILLHKLSYYRVKGIAYPLIQSYLTQRQQIVEYNVCKSEKMFFYSRSPTGFCARTIPVFDLFK